MIHSGGALQYKPGMGWGVRLGKERKLNKDVLVNSLPSA